MAPPKNRKSKRKRKSSSSKLPIIFSLTFAGMMLIAGIIGGVLWWQSRGESDSQPRKRIRNGVERRFEQIAFDTPKSFEVDLQATSSSWMDKKRLLSVYCFEYDPPEQWNGSLDALKSHHAKTTNESRNKRVHSSRVVNHPGGFKYVEMDISSGHGNEEVRELALLIPTSNGNVIYLGMTTFVPRTSWNDAKAVFDQIIASLKVEEVRANTNNVE